LVKKVSSCVSLFSLDKLDIVPVDTHVFKISKKYLPSLKDKTLNNTNHKKINDFFIKQFKVNAGWASTILFANRLPYYNNSKKKRKSEENDKENIPNKKRKLNLSKKE